MVKLIFFLLFCICINSTVHAQASSFDSAGVFTGKPDIPPSHKGGLDNWIKFLHLNIINRQDTLEGPITVIVSFVIDEKGNLSGFKTIKDTGKGIVEDVIRCIKSGPGYLPAMVKGKPVKYRYTETINLETLEN